MYIDIPRGARENRARLPALEQLTWKHISCKFVLCDSSSGLAGVICPSCLQLRGHLIPGVPCYRKRILRFDRMIGDSRSDHSNVLSMRTSTNLFFLVVRLTRSILALFCLCTLLWWSRPVWFSRCSWPVSSSVSHNTHWLELCFLYVSPSPIPDPQINVSIGVTEDTFVNVGSVNVCRLHFRYLPESFQLECISSFL